MSTRGAIARVEGDGFKGVYHHWDSYPSGLGATLYQIYHDHFKEDLEAMLKVLIDEHPAGWSTINGGDFAQTPGFLNEHGDNDRPQCYCHGDRKEEGSEVTHLNAAGIGVEYVYAFDGHTMLVLSSYTEEGKKMIGMFGMGDPKARWRIMARVDLDGPEPDWEHLAQEPAVA